MTAVDAGRLRHLAQLVDEAARLYGEAPAFARALAPERGITFAQLQHGMNAGAAALQTGDAGAPVLLVLETGPLWPAAFFAVLRAGRIAVPLPPEVGPQAVARVAGLTGAQSVIGSASTRGLATEGLPFWEVEKLLAGPGAVGPAGTPTDVAVLVFTSGSTDRPRAVELTHANLLGNLQGVLGVRCGEPGDSVLSMLHPAHAFELMVGLLVPLACGARVVSSGPLLPNRLVEITRREVITHAVAVPALASCLYDEILDQLVEADVVALERRSQKPAEIVRHVRGAVGPTELVQLRDAIRTRIGRSFRSLIVGGASLDPALGELIDLMGVRVEIGYGLTEAGPVVCVGAVGESPPGSVGRPVPGVEVRLADDGEVLVRGPGVMHGYLGDPEGTAAALRDGWLHTGDRGRMDENGHLFVLGRSKEAMVTAAGRTLYPEEVEPYYQSPLFAERCVAALPAEHENDLPTLFVVVAGSAAAGDLRAEFARLRAAAPAHLRLEQIVCVEGPLPRTPTGKVRRRQVATTYAAARPRE